MLGRVFNELGLVEQWGSGVQRMIAARLARLVKRGLVREVGTSANDPRRTYVLASDRIP